MSSIKIMIADITTMNTDCIVNAANENLRVGGGVCGAIYNKAGAKELNAACRERGSCPTGYAVTTPGFKLKAKYIIHAVGPIWTNGYSDRELLTSCYKVSLERAKENDCHSIAFPLISSGRFGCPKNKAWTQAIKGVVEWTEEHPDYDIDIIFTVMDQATKDLGDKCLLAFMDPELRPDQGNYILFWKLGQRNEEFTNFYPCKFKVDGISYNCVEQYMMAEKARLFKDEEVLEMVMTSSDPDDIKSYGRLVKGFDTNVWDKHKWNIVYEGNFAKYDQNQKLKIQLLNTWHTTLAEASPKDKIWGIGLDRDDPYARSPEHWPGQNLLGKILMKIRDEYLISRKEGGNGGVVFDDYDIKILEPWEM